MREVCIDVSAWKNWQDFYDGLLPALGAPPWHGRNFNALNDSIGTGGINAFDPLIGSASLAQEK